MRKKFKFENSNLTRVALIPLLLTCTLSASSFAGDSLPPEINELRAAWDDANFVLQGDDQKRAMLELVIPFNDRLIDLGATDDIV